MHSGCVPRIAVVATTKYGGPLREIVDLDSRRGQSARYWICWRPQSSTRVTGSCVSREKNVKDSRRRVWMDAGKERFGSFTELNAWLGQRCRALWDEVRHPE